MPSNEAVSASSRAPRRLRAVPSAPSPDEIARTRAAQRLAYRCAEEVAATLEPGVTEREAARRMRAWLTAEGVTDFLHLPFAWFGDRTAFHAFRSPLAFFPTERRLERGMPFILDVAPVLDGAQADVGYTACLDAHAGLDDLRAALLEHRALVLELVRARRPLSEVYLAVDELARRQGLRNRHKEYPLAVLAHRLAAPKRVANGTLLGFGLGSLRGLGESAAASVRAGWSPFWNGGGRSSHVPVPGLWAVEPHLACGPLGAKFEEVLVVTEDDAYWLDDDVPHVRGAARRAA